MLDDVRSYRPLFGQSSLVVRKVETNNSRAVKRNILLTAPKISTETGRVSVRETPKAHKRLNTTVRRNAIEKATIVGASPVYVPILGV